MIVQMFTLLRKLKKRGAVVGASMHVSGWSMEQKAANGLVTSHAYSVLKIKELPSRKFVKLRNPWGKSGACFCGLVPYILTIRTLARSSSGIVIENTYRCAFPRCISLFYFISVK